MARKCSTINLVINIILLNILHISALSLIRPITYPTLFHVLWPLNCFSNIWNESETIIDVICCCPNKRCQKLLFIDKGNWRIQCSTILEKTGECRLKKFHEYILDNIHKRSILSGIETRSVNADSNPIRACLCEETHDESYFVISLDKLWKNFLYWIPKHRLHESSMTTEILARSFYITRSIIHIM